MQTDQDPDTVSQNIWESGFRKLKMPHEENIPKKFRKKLVENVLIDLFLKKVLTLHLDPDPATKINKNPQGPDCNTAYTKHIMLRTAECILMK